VNAAGPAFGKAPLFLFSVDVEEVDGRALNSGGISRVPAMTARYLDFLRREGAHGTFFVTGQVARAHPALVTRILAEGHEIGCHSDRHLPLHELGPEAFRNDSASALEALSAAGARYVAGYRAPCFSLTERTPWAHSVLTELGFSYSSSVLPARSPLHGWPGFGEAPRVIDGILELPMSLLSPRRLPVPTGGVYLRALPWTLVRAALKARARSGAPVLGYLHPYDIDAEQERFPHPGFSRWGVYNWLMYRNRKGLLSRLENIARLGFRFEAYGPYAAACRATASAGEIA
jgi:polysaccharide deacetylase family protein (PEP-CTERM system associated)